MSLLDDKVDQEHLERALASQVDQLSDTLAKLVAVGGPAAVDQDAIRRILTLSIKLYVARRQQGEDFSPVMRDDSITATEASIATTGLLDAVNLDLFELSLWKYWGTA